MQITYHMPAEWEKQEAIWLAWPHRKDEWVGRFPAVDSVFTDIARVIAQGQKVNIFAKNEKHKAHIHVLLENISVNISNINIYIKPTNRIWMRDSGGIFVRQGKQQFMLDFRFNGWAKWPDHRLDNTVPEAMSAITGIPAIQPMHKGRRVVLEGGSIDVNGQGALITTEECLQSHIQERNPSFTKDDYAEVFAKYFGISEVIWLGEGIKGDDTHGHVDDITRFVNADTIVTAVDKDSTSPNHAALKENLKRLKRTRYNVVELPMPKRLVTHEGNPLPASYGNFLITNHAVLVPTFNDPHDRIALNILAELFPKREVVGIHARDLVLELGTLHCLSQQQPV